MGLIIKIGKDPATDTNIQGENFKINDNDKFVSRHHAYIHVVSKNPLKMTLTAISINDTLLNGTLVEKNKPKELNVGDVIQLVDNQRSKIKVNDILAFAQVKIPSLDGPVVQKYTTDFLQLKDVYDIYNAENLKLSKKEALINGLRTVVFSLGASSAAFFGFITNDNGVLQVIRIGFPLGVSLGAILILNKLNPKEQANKLLEKFKIDYVCPNHKCSHSFYGMPWELLARPGHCKYCKTSWLNEEKNI